MATPDATPDERHFNFPYEAELHATFPALHKAQDGYMSQIDSLPAPERTTHELIRLACSVGIRNAVGVRRHAQLAAEVGATWEDVLGAVMLSIPAFGVHPAAEAIPIARRGFERAGIPETDDDDDLDHGRADGATMTGAE